MFEELYGLKFGRACDIVRINDPKFLYQHTDLLVNVSVTLFDVIIVNIYVIMWIDYRKRTCHYISL